MPWHTAALLYAATGLLTTLLAGGIALRARALDAAHAEAVILLGELQRARAAERQPLEDRVQALFDSGRGEEAAETARQVLSRWPESRVAGRVLRTFLDRQKQERAHRLTRFAWTEIH